MARRHPFNPRAVPTTDTPLQNQLLARLPATVLKRLLAQARLVPLHLGERLCEEGAALPGAWFPVAGFVSLLISTPEHPSLELGMAGPEGCLGATLALGADTAATSCPPPAAPPWHKRHGGGVCGNQGGDRNHLGSDDKGGQRQTRRRRPPPIQWYEIALRRTRQRRRLLATHTLALAQGAKSIDGANARLHTLAHANPGMSRRWNAP